MKFKVAAIIALSLLLVSTNGISGSCSQIGSTTYGSDGSSYLHSGNTTYGSDGTTCMQVGDTTYCD